MYSSISLIIPVYNRPDEISELLESLSHQTDPDFEVIVVEDGSSVCCKQEVDAFSSVLDVKYFVKPNSGPGLSRNYGFERSSGDYGVFLDSDCIIPTHYVAEVKKQLLESHTDCFGGPDRASKDFTVLQKAINYSMTSMITTGGIRGGGESMDTFHPRSFNMGYSREVFGKTGGFGPMRFGEDIDMSLRILEAGFTTSLFSNAYVYHKRRTKIRQFFKQVFNSGIARINLNFRHPGTLKLVHALPAIFVLGVVGLLVGTWWFYPYSLWPLVGFMALVFFDSSLRNTSVGIGFLSIITTFVQLGGYGLGFLYATWKRMVMGRGEFASFEKTFYD